MPPDALEDMDAADRLIDAIMSGIRLLADHPRMGRARGESPLVCGVFPRLIYLDYLYSLPPRPRLY